jgi:tRNA(Arg) A34 adenosine deaminase TadA
VAVLDETFVGRARRQADATGDPTAHAVITVLREAVQWLGRTDHSWLIVFSAVEACAMCVGAAIESDVDGLVYASPDAKTVQPRRSQRAGFRSCRGSCNARQLSCDSQPRAAVDARLGTAVVLTVVLRRHNNPSDATLRTTSLKP